MGKTQSTGNLTNAIAQDSSNNIGIGGAVNASFKLQVTGTTNLTSDLTVNGLTVGKGAGSIVSNTAVGLSALPVNTTGTLNTAIGNLALLTNTTGYGNTSVGYGAIGYNTTGFFNAAIGVNALLFNSTGTYNNALGTAALYANTTGSYNTAVGQQAGTANTTGSNNTYIGYSSGFNITTGSNNTIIGRYFGTAAMSNNIVLADGAGNVRYQWDGTNNVFGNPLSGTSATFSGNVNVVGTLIAGNASNIGKVEIGSVGSSSTAQASAYLRIGDEGAARFWLQQLNSSYDFTIRHFNSGWSSPLLTIASTGAATFSSSVTAGTLGVGTSPIGAFKVSIQGDDSGQVLRLRNTTTRYRSDFSISNSGELGINCYDDTASTYMPIKLDASKFSFLQGNVGIGTSSPSFKLDLQNAGTFGIRLNNIGDGADTYIQYNNVNSAFSIGINSDGWFSYTGGTKKYDWWIANVVRMTLSNTGQLQIKQAGNTLNNDGLGLYNTSGNIWGIIGGGDNNLYIGYNYDARGYFSSSTGVYINLSDKNKKKDFEQSDIGLQAILELKPTLYRMKDDETNGNKELGFIAQEVKEFIPQAFVESEDFIGLNYNPIVAALVKSVQELEARIKQLENK